MHTAKYFNLTLRHLIQHANNCVALLRSVNNTVMVESLTTGKFSRLPAITVTLLTSVQISVTVLQFTALLHCRPAT